jgi:hypothetical protein
MAQKLGHWSERRLVLRRRFRYLWMARLVVWWNSGPPFLGVALEAKLQFVPDPRLRLRGVRFTRGVARYGSGHP